jgi:hypothetical protein
MKNEKRNLLMGFSLILTILLGMTCTVFAMDNAAFGPKTTGGEPLWRLISATDALNSNLSKIETALVDASLSLSDQASIRLHRGVFYQISLRWILL